MTSRFLIRTGSWPRNGSLKCLYANSPIHILWTQRQRRAPCRHAFSSFAACGIPSHLLGKLEKQGYRQPTYVQSQALSKIMNDTESDFLIHAPTGTGKTLCYVAPILSKLDNHVSTVSEKVVHGIICVPTRELAVQVQKLLEDLTKAGKKKKIHEPEKAATISVRRVTGEISAIKLNTLKSDPPHVIVGTPKSLATLVPKHIQVGKLSYFVADEVDHLLFSFSKPDFLSLAKRLNRMTNRPQNIWVSVTSSDQIEKTASRYLPNFTRISTHEQDASEMPSSIEHYMLECVSEQQKKNMIPRLMAAVKPKGVIIFVNSKTTAMELSHWLFQEKNIPAVELINDGRNNKDRAKALSKIKRGSATVLIATEMAARGLDIPKLTHVINYDLPNFPREYIHRSGRVGRINSTETGVSISLVSSKDEATRLNNIGKTLKVEINPVALKNGQMVDVGKGISAIMAANSGHIKFFLMKWNQKIDMHLQVVELQNRSEVINFNQSLRELSPGLRTNLRFTEQLKVMSE